jgi:sigma-B regulation protein RsbU (phosphoserine phosphatase)
MGRPTSFKALYRKLDDALAQIQRTEDVSGTLETILESLLQRFEDELGFEGGRIYVREGSDFYLCCGFGRSQDAPVGLRVPRDYPPHVRTLSKGLLIMRRGERGFDSEWESAVGVDSTFAAIAVGEGNSHVIAFSIKGAVREEQLLYSLTAVRHVINLKLQQQKLVGVLEEARVIQESILPEVPPTFQGYDIHAASSPAETVGGDLYDYVRLSSDVLGIAIGDSSGHGLPAALLARDVITGLRMGVTDESQIVPIVERLNWVIHRGTLASKFVSLFYAELERGGGLTYCNAGHDPPLLLHDGTFTELPATGTVLGPIPGARYETAAANLESGDVLLMYTDGVVERENRDGSRYGTDRLRQLVRSLGSAGARRIATAVLSAAAAHGEGVSAADDMTALVVRKL